VLNFVCGVEGVGTSSGFPHYKVYFYTEHNIYNEGNFAHTKKKNSFQGQQSIKNCLSICKRRKKTPSDVRLANQTEEQGKEINGIKKTTSNVADMMSSICNAEEEGQASSIYIMRQSRGAPSTYTTKSGGLLLLLFRDAHICARHHRRRKSQGDDDDDLVETQWDGRKWDDGARLLD